MLTSILDVDILQQKARRYQQGIINRT